MTVDRYTKENSTNPAVGSEKLHFVVAFVLCLMRSNLAILIGHDVDSLFLCCSV